MSKNDFKNFLIGIFSSLIATLIISIVTIVSGIFVIFMSNKIFSFRNSIILIYIISVVIFIVKIFYVDRNNKPHFPKLTIDYKYKDVETELNFISKEKAVYTSTYNIIALKELSYVKRSHYWSGDEIKELPMVYDSGNIHDIELLKSHYGRIDILIRFVIPIQVNQNIKFTIKYNLSNLKKEMEPFLRHTVNNPTEKVLLRLVVPNNLVKNVIKCIYADSTYSIELCKPEKLCIFRQIDGFSIYEWEILKPSLLYYYLIKWEFV